MSDWQDRVVDAALRQMHGERPPDQTAIVLHRLQTELEPITRLPEAAASAPALRSRWRTLLGGSALGAAAALLLTWLVLPKPLPDRGPAARIDVASLEGAAEFAELAAADAPPRTFMLAQGERAEWRAQAGNWLLSRGDRGVELSLAPFGVVSTGTNTRMEVRSMELSIRNGAIVTGAMTFAVVSGVVTWHTLSHNETVAAGKELRVEAPKEPGPDAAIASAQLAKENQELRDRVQQLETQLARQPAPAAPAVKTTDEAAKPPEPAAADSKGKPAFDNEQFREMLMAIDWDAVGEANKEIAPLLNELADALSEDGAKLPIDKAIQIQKLNQKLVEMLPAMMKAGLPGFGPNGVFTHPLVASNSMASLLQSAGQGLDDNQRSSIASIVRAYSAELQGIAGQSGDLDLAGLAAETSAKDRFYSEMSAMLSPEQRALVYPEGKGQYDGTNLFNTGVEWRSVSDPLPVSSPADYARVATDRLETQLGLDEATAAQVRAVLDRAAANSPGLFRDRAAPVEQSQAAFMRSGRAAQALQTQLGWMREIERTVPLTPDQLRRLSSLRRVYVPLPR
jgi:hypothetical protein